ncbi:hypothetical protein HDV62DRAFT_25501 [Trichoderma sp. SZMC 28011]
MIRPEGPARRPSLTQMPDAWMPIFREPTLDRRFCKAGNKGIRDGPNGSETVSRCLAACVCVCVPAGVGCLSLFFFFIFSLSIVHHSLLSLPDSSLTIEPTSISSVLTQAKRSLFLPSGRRCCCPRTRRFLPRLAIRSSCPPNPNPKPISSKKIQPKSQQLRIPLLLKTTTRVVRNGGMIMA